MQPRLRPVLLLTALALTGAAAPATADAATPDPNCAPSPTNAARVVCSWTTTGGYTFTVPSGVTSLQVDAVGGAGARSPGVIRPAGGGKHRDDPRGGRSSAHERRHD